MPSDNLMKVENLALRPVIVRRAEEVVMPRGIENASEGSRVWKRAGAVAAAGMLFGFGTATWFEVANLPVQKVKRWVRFEDSNTRQTPPSVAFSRPMPVNQTANGTIGIGDVGSPEVERLKTRNRRLEALVKVLQKRSHVKKRVTGPSVKN